MHFEATFEERVTFTDEAALRGAFGTERLHVAAGAAISLEGMIRLGLDVAFVGSCDLVGPVVIEVGCQLSNVRLGAETTIRGYSILSDVAAGRQGIFGPYCFLRDGVTAGDRCILGAHVEAARSRFGAGVKVSHRAFIGDAEVDDDVILGAGTTFCNFDGEGRRLTRVGRGVSVGSGSLIVAPLTIGDGAVIGAGSTLTRDVPAGARVIQKRASGA